MARARELARASWMTFLIVIGVNAISSQTGAPLVKGLMSLVLCVAGFSFGVAALFVRRGTKATGVVSGAVAGIVLNGFVLFAFVLGFMAAITKR